MSNGNPESLLAQWFRRVWNEADRPAIYALSTPDMLSHGLKQTIRGPDAWKSDFYEPMRQAFSEVRVEVLDEVQSGDRIFARLVATLTPQGGATSVRMPGTCLMRIAEGKIAEAWDVWDFLGLLEGMRLLPRGSFAQAITGHLSKHPQV